jgi:hypothetical protein
LALVGLSDGCYGNSVDLVSQALHYLAGQGPRLHRRAFIVEPRDWGHRQQRQSVPDRCAGFHWPSGLKPKSII